MLVKIIKNEKNEYRNNQGTMLYIVNVGCFTSLQTFAVTTSLKYPA